MQDGIDTATVKSMIERFDEKQLYLQPVVVMERLDLPL